jgi:CRISPR-associated protein Csd2
MSTATLVPAINKRYDFVMLFDVTNGNPNGDPDAGNAPRIDHETGHGLVSDVCLKRKIRNYVSLAKSGDGGAEPGYDVYVKEKAVLNHQHRRAYEALKLPIDDKTGKSKPGREDDARRWMCQTFFDVRMFGAVMSTGINAGQVRGPVQLTFARSIDPIVSLEQAITRMAVTTEQEAQKQEGGNRTMGRKEIVPYALYRAHGFISPQLARDTGFHGDDLSLLWKALHGMFDLDRSAARGEMTMRRVVAFEHECTLGNAPAHRLFERVVVTRRDTARPPRAYTDYEVAVNDLSLPDGVKLVRMPGE